MQVLRKQKKKKSPPQKKEKKKEKEEEEDLQLEKYDIHNQYIHFYVK